MRRGRRLLLIALAVVLFAALIVGFVPDARGWMVEQVRSIRMRVVLSTDFGSRLRSVKSGKWHLEDHPATGATIELFGGLSQQDLCRAMLALDEISSSEPALLRVLIVRPDAGMTFEELTWNRASGRLEHWVGDGAYSDCLSTSMPRGEIPSGVDAAMVQRLADGESIEWQ